MALRTFHGRDGTLWNVWDVVPTLVHNDRKVALSTGMTSGWLCFESGGVKRRIVPAPNGWEEWSEDELDSALATALTVERRLPPEGFGSAANPVEHPEGS
ncbi:MAG: hypothetical protein ACJ8GN_11200 [Longimicrobiaceae bacterium]